MKAWGWGAFGLSLLPPGPLLGGLLLEPEVPLQPINDFLSTSCIYSCVNAGS